MSEGNQQGVVTDPVKVSVVVACYNAERHIATQLEAIARQECPWPWEVILSDNGSTDRTVAIAEPFRERMPCLRIVDSSGERGAAAARNNGVRNARGRGSCSATQTTKWRRGGWPAWRRLCPTTRSWRPPGS